MKKSLLNIAVSIAMSGTLLSASLLSSQAYADEAAAAAVSSVDSNEETSLKTYLYPGMGVGAATGTVVAGPIGFVIGGLIGAFVGAGQEVGDTTSPLTESDVIAENSLQHDNLADEVDQTETVLPGIQLAQIGEIDAVFTDSNDIHQDVPKDVPKDELIDSLTTDLGLDVYFRSGSSNIESFYPARLSAIASLLNSLDRLGSEKLALHLDGYSDRRGDQAKNIALANERIEKVRQQLIAAGVAEERISGKAFGEMKMVSTAGDLEGYTFDRKVVIRFERAATDPVHEMAAAFSALPSEAPAIEVTAIVDSAIETPVIENPAVTANDSSINPVVAEAGSRF